MNLFEPQRDPLLGRKLDGRYEVLGRLGEGGVGVVYKGRQTQLGRLVAIKVLHQDAAVVPEWRRRFEREARALSALAHPNVVSVTDFGIDHGVPFLVMELLQGKLLADLIKEGPQQLPRALDIASQVLRGLSFAHGKGIVHRDLKPTNVYLQALPDQADHVRLLDFGMAKFLEGAHSRTMAESLTRIGVVFGTPAYMSPEQAKAQAVDARTDVYAAGIMLFELIAGRRPFVADSAEGYITQHLSQPVPSLAKVRPEIAAAAPLFQPVVEKAMAKKPSARFKDAAAMLAALEAAEARLPSVAVAAGSRPEAARRKPTPRPRAPLQQPKSRPRLMRRAIFLLAIAGGLAVVGVVLLRDGAKPVEPAAPPPPKSALHSPRPRPALPPPKPVLPPEPLSPSPPPAPKAALPVAPPPTPAPALPSPPPSKPEPPVPPPPLPVAKAPAENHAKPAAEARPESDARNPWKESVPRALKPIRDRVARGAKMSQRSLKPVYAYARENPDDPRPWLLLGHAYAELDWYSDSIERYQKAIQIDRTTRGDPAMLPDLIKAAVHPVAGKVGGRAIRDIYGAEAIPALEKAIERRPGSDVATRLDRLRDTLR